MLSYMEITLNGFAYLFIISNNLISTLHHVSDIYSKREITLSNLFALFSVLHWNRERS